MEQMNIKSLLRSKQTLLESKLDVLINHPVTKGDHCEGAWIDFFRSFLPSKQPHKVDIPAAGLLDFPGRIDVLGISIGQDFEHGLRIHRRISSFGRVSLIQ